MKAFTIMAVAAAMLAGGAGMAAAQPSPATTPSCVGVAHTPAAAQVWWGRFAGGREHVFSRVTAPIGVVVEGCFPSGAACENWLYGMKGEYSALPILAACSRGYKVGPIWPPGSRQ